MYIFLFSCFSLLCFCLLLHNGCTCIWWILYCHVFLHEMLFLFVNVHTSMSYFNKFLCFIWIFDRLYHKKVKYKKLIIHHRISNILKQLFSSLDNSKSRCESKTSKNVMTHCTYEGKGHLVVSFFLLFVF